MTDDTSKLIARLRKRTCTETSVYEPTAKELEAADALTRLSQQVAELKIDRNTWRDNYYKDLSRANQSIAELESKIKQQSLEYVSLFDQCSEALAKVAEQENELRALIEDNTSMRDSLTKEATARCEAEDRVAALESHRIFQVRLTPGGWFDCSESQYRDADGVDPANLRIAYVEKDHD